MRRYVGDITTMVLVPQVVDAVKVPVIAAGEFMTDGVGGSIGFRCSGCADWDTVYLCCGGTAHENYKQAIIKAKDRDTVLTGYEGHFVRVIKNKLTKEFERLIKEQASPEKLEKLGTGRLKAAVVDGDVEMGSVMSGQIAAAINKIQPAAEIINEIMHEAETIIRKLGTGSCQGTVL